MTADVLVVGAGLAGLHTATLLARRGHAVLLADRRRRLDGAVRTTGIFVRKTLDDFPLPAEHLGPPIRRVVLHPPGLRRPVVLDSDRDEYRVGDMGPLYLAVARELQPDVVVVDIEMPQQFGLTWATTLAESLPGSGAAFLLFGGEPAGTTRASSVTVLLAWAAGALLLGWLRLSRGDAR